MNFTAIILIVSFLSTLNYYYANGEMDIETFDSIMDSVSEQLNNVKIPDFEIGFQKLVFHGKIKIYNINVSGLDTIRRVGNVTMVTNSDGNTNIEAKIALGFLRFTGSSVVQVMGIGPRHDFKGSIAYIESSAKLTLKRDGKMILNQFKLHDLDDTSLKLNGPLLTIDFITNTALRLVLANFTSSIKWILERVLTRVISSKVSDQKFIDSLLNGS